MGGGFFENDGFTVATAGNCGFSNNSATEAGGAMYISTGTMWVFGGTFSNDSAVGDPHSNAGPFVDGVGGGIFNAGSLTLLSCSFSSNTAWNGGGVFNSQGTLITSDCTFSQNQVTQSGAGVYADGGYVNGWGTIFSQNEAGAFGGGMENLGAAVYLTDCTFANNSAWSAGGIVNLDGTISISDCTFSQNSASYEGGGIFQYDGSLTNTNCTFFQNSATEYGGGVFQSQGTMQATDCTFYQNAAQTAGGGLYIQGSALLNGDIVIGDTSGSGANVKADDIDGYYLNANSSYNLVGIASNWGFWYGPGNQVNVPVAMAGLGNFGYYNGGLTETIPLELGSYALAKGLVSGVWNSATNNVNPFLDQNNAYRVIGIQGDVGAFQFSNPPWVVYDLSSTTFDLVSPLPANPTFTATAGNVYTDNVTSAPLTVQWEVSTDGGNTFTPLALGGSLYGNSVTTDTLTLNGADITPAMNGYEYEAVFTSGAGETAISSAATLTVDYTPTTTSNPNNVTVDAGGTVTFTAAASGNPTPSVQWEYSTDGIFFYPLSDGSFQGATISGSLTDTLTINDADYALNGYQFEAVFTNTLSGSPTPPPSTATTTAATLTVDSGPTNVSPPSPITVNAGDNTTFTVSAQGNPAPSVQWYVNQGNGFTPLAPAASMAPASPPTR